MFRKLIFAFVAVAFVFTAVGTLSAMELGNKRKGKYTYRKVYKACFERGEVASKTPFLSPSDKTQAEWEALYTSGDYSQMKCAEEWAGLGDKDVKDIFTYLYSHGSDSPTPAKCK